MRSRIPLSTRDSECASVSLSNNLRAITCVVVQTLPNKDSSTQTETHGHSHTDTDTDTEAATQKKDTTRDTYALTT